MLTPHSLEEDHLACLYPQMLLHFTPSFKMHPQHTPNFNTIGRAHHGLSITSSERTCPVARVLKPFPPGFSSPGTSQVQPYPPPQFFSQYLPFYRVLKSECARLPWRASENTTGSTPRLLIQQNWVKLRAPPFYLLSPGLLMLLVHKTLRINKCSY